MNKYCIKDGYMERLDNSFHDDRGLTDGHQDEVYKYAKEVYIKHNLRSVLDIGCGSAYKLFKYFSGESIVGVDLEPTVSWLKDKFPSENFINWDYAIPVNNDLLICADMIEHVVDPDLVLEFIVKCNPRRIIISTPDRRLLLKGQDGPPNNEAHVREWTFHEFNKYISSRGFEIHNHFISNKEQCTQVVDASL